MGSEKKQLELISHENIKFLGFVSDAEIKNIIKNISHTILTQHLNLLASFNYKKLAQTLRCKFEEAEAAAKLISNLSPKPVSGEWGDPAKYVKPDLIAEKFNAKWSIRLNHEHIPKLGLIKNMPI